MIRRLFYDATTIRMWVLAVLAIAPFAHLTSLLGWRWASIPLDMCVVGIFVIGSIVEVRSAVRQRHLDEQMVNAKRGVIVASKPYALHLENQWIDTTGVEDTEPWKLANDKRPEL